MIAWKCPKADYLTVRPWPNAVTHLDCLQPAQPSAFDPKRTWHAPASKFLLWRTDGENCS
jgi:hypothetical protein